MFVCLLKHKMMASVLLLTNLRHSNCTEGQFMQNSVTFLSMPRTVGMSHCQAESNFLSLKC